MTAQPRNPDHDRTDRWADRIAEAIRVQATTGPSRSGAVTWTRAQLQDRLQRVRRRMADAVGEPAHRQARDPDHAPLADWEGRAVTTTETSITKDMTPLEAANLLAKLEEAQQAAWQSTWEAPSSQRAEYRSRFQNAMEVDGVFQTSCKRPPITACGARTNR